MYEVYEYLKSCGVYYLATIEENQPRVRPFGTIDLFENKLYIQTGKIKKVANQMKINPKVEISGMNKGSWIRLSAEAILDERIEAQEHMLEAYPSLKKQYQAGDGNTEVYYLKNVIAEIFSFGKESIKYEF